MARKEQRYIHSDMLHLICPSPTLRPEREYRQSEDDSIRSSIQSILSRSQAVVLGFHGQEVQDDNDNNNNNNKEGEGEGGKVGKPEPKDNEQDVQSISQASNNAKQDDGSLETQCCTIGPRQNGSWIAANHDQHHCSVPGAHINIYTYCTFLVQRRRENMEMGAQKNETLREEGKGNPNEREEEEMR